jgi:hypothetical protein
MRFSRMLLAFGLIGLSLTPTWGQANADEPKATPSKVTAVTVYQNTALITREAAAPDAIGLHEIVLNPLPVGCVQSSLYAEGSDGIRVLTVRYRTRAISEDNREEVRKLEAKIKEAQKKLVVIQADQKALDENTKFLAKLEGFTAATLNSLTEKGQLDSEKTIALVTFIQNTRTKASKELVAMTQQMEVIQEDMAFTQRLLSEKAGRVSRTERDALVFIDKTKAGAGTIKLNYLVSNATWKPQYKLRAGAKENDKVNMEYQASVTQQTGEDWTNVALTLSTAQPMLNASPPDLLALELSIGGPQITSAPTGPGGPSGSRSAQVGQAVPGMGGQGLQNPAYGFGGGNRGGDLKASELKELDDVSRSLRKQSQNNLNLKNSTQGNFEANNAAALEQFRDLLVAREDLGKMSSDGTLEDGPSVTYKLKDKFSLPSRNDDQIIEVSRTELTPKFYYKAVPVLTPHVYRLADLMNTTDLVLLPGEVTTYLGSDFVGQTKLPLIAIGKPFTVGFGADPQLQVSRKLVDRTRVIQGGNQILTFKYKIMLNTYKTNTIDVQVWDRLPHAESSMTIGINLVKGDTELSKDPLYVRDERPKNLLRWDVKLEPKQNGEKALSVDYEYKMELDRNVTIGSFIAK